MRHLWLLSLIPTFIHQQDILTLPSKCIHILTFVPSVTTTATPGHAPIISDLDCVITSLWPLLNTSNHCELSEPYIKSCHSCLRTLEQLPMLPSVKATDLTLAPEASLSSFLIQFQPQWAACSFWNTSIQPSQNLCSSSV